MSDIHRFNLLLPQPARQIPFVDALIGCACRAAFRHMLPIDAIAISPAHFADDDTVY